MKGKKELILKGNLIIGKLKSVQKGNSTSTEDDKDDETSDPTSIEDYNKKTTVQLRQINKEKGLQVKNLTMKVKKKELITLIENS